MSFRFTLIQIFKNIFFKSIEKVLSINTNIYITINNEDYNFKDNISLKKSMLQNKCVGLDIFAKKNVKKNFKKISKF